MNERLLTPDIPEAVDEKLSYEPAPRPLKRYVTKAAQRRAAAQPRQFENSGAGRNRARRALQRADARSAKRTNNRRWRNWYSQQFHAGTVRQQIRVHLGLIGNDQQRILVRRAFESQARANALPLEDYVAQLAALLGMTEPVSAPAEA